MGRLQRKKDPAKKKKKQNGETSMMNGGDVISKKTLFPSGTGEKGKSFPSSTRKKSSVAGFVPGTVKKGFSESIQFLREVKAELRKVTWPSRKQTIGSTVVMITLVMIISFFLGAVDMGLSGLIRVVLQ
jgi:preprotein translocase subunit SecE